MGGVSAYVLQIVVLARDTHNLLCVGRARIGPGPGAEKDVLKLVHAGVGKQQCGVVLRYQARAGHPGMSPLDKIIEEGLANLCAAQRSGHTLSLHGCGRRIGDPALHVNTLGWDGDMVAKRGWMSTKRYMWRLWRYASGRGCRKNRAVGMSATRKTPPLTRVTAARARLESAMPTSATKERAPLRMSKALPTRSDRCIR